MISTRSVVLASLALSLFAAACGGGDDGGSSPSDGDPSSAGPGGGGPSSGGPGSAGTGGGVTSSTSGEGPGGPGSGSVGSGPAGGGGSDPSGTGGGPPACNDGGPGEPANGDVSSPFGLPAISDCDSAAGTVAGTLGGAADTDWYLFNGNDTVACSVDPTVTVTPSSTPVCVYFFCQTGTASVSCPAGTTSATDAYGDPGCCGTGTVAPTLNCTGSSDEAALVYIEVQDDGASCTPYSVAYHF